MAYLLGSKSCIDSLRIDIEDLENVIHDIVGKTGSLKCHSWKFPDKLATDVEIAELVKRYQYRTNELDNQVSHVVLFELIIDRLLLVLHGSWRFLEDIHTKFGSSTIDQPSSSLSIGLVTKKYWNKLVELSNAFQIRKIEKPPIVKHSKTSITSEKHCQTIETSFSPCASCTHLQQYFRDYSNSIINLCNLYNLPSSLAYHRCLTSVIPEWMSYDDITQWSDCQTKDFDRLAKHLEYLNSTLNQTKTSLDNSENQCKKQNEINEQLRKINQEEKQSFEKKFAERNQMELKLIEQIQSLNTEKESLNKQLNELKDECACKTEQIQKFEPTKNELKILTDQRSKSDELIKNLEQIRIRLETELEIVKRDLDERNRDLKKERLRIETMIRQEENTQTKQKTLTKSYDDLVQECQSLKKQLIEIQSQRDDLQKFNEQISSEISSLKSNNQELYQQIIEREPHRTLNKSSQTTAPIDIYIQNNENQLRITVLEKENDALKSSLEKALFTDEVRNRSRSYSSAPNETTIPKQTPLFLLNTEILERQQAFTESRSNSANYIPRFSENDYAANGWIRSDPDVIPLPSRTSNHPMTIHKTSSRISHRPPRSRRSINE